MTDNDFTDLPLTEASVIPVPPGHPEYQPPPHESDTQIAADLISIDVLSKLVLAKVVAGASLPPPGQRLIEYDITPCTAALGPHLPTSMGKRVMRHVVMYSGGIGSWATASRVIDEHDAAGVVLLFADVKGNTDNPHVGESEDSYRFIAESAWRFGAELVWLRSTENIWEVFTRRRYLGNSRQAHCSMELKQKPCRAWLDANCDPDDTIVYVGIDWSESHRIPAIEKAYEPFRVRFPMTEPPYRDKHQMLADCRASGVEPPAAYAEGWSHSNCQGGCVRAGKAHWKKLLQLYPERYAYHETEEQKLRDYLGKDVAILTDTSYDPDDIGGCGCFTAETLPDRPAAKKVPLTLRAFRERVESDQQGELFNIKVEAK